MLIIVFYVVLLLSEAISLSDEIVVLSKRPAKIKTIHKINFDKNILPTERRRTNKFNEYYDIIWKEIEHHV